MKAIVFIFLFATLCVACDDNPVISSESGQNIVRPDLTQIRIKENPGETLKYIGRIGKDFDTALDSLRKLKEISSEITKEPLDVLFDYDSRLFFGINYADCMMYSDVLDTDGNYYARTWYISDLDVQEERFFIENKTFTIGNGGAAILYQSRIGHDFDSALDSLIKKYEPILIRLAQEGHYSGKGYDIDQEKVNVNFSYDSREFRLLTFIDKSNRYNILFTGEVVDEKGNYFMLMNPPD
jgi:hypothetical protein